MHRALITGGTAGIGAAFATALARRGADLVLVARDADRLAQSAQELAAAHGIHVETMRADLADREDQQRVADRLEADPDDPATPPIDVFVANAGFSVTTPLLDADMNEHDRGFEVMQLAVLLQCGAAGRAMSRRGAGHIITIGSVSAFITQSNYTAIKSWVNNYSEALAVQLRGSGVSVTLVNPGWVRTEFHSRAGIKGSSIPSVLWLSPQRIAEEALDDAARGRVCSVPSRRFQLITGVLRVLPRPVIHRLSGLLSHRRSRER